MYADKIYCVNCKKLYFDTWTIYDTRTNREVENQCPHCRSNNNINASQLIEEFELNAHNPSNNVVSKILYEKMKRIVKKSNIKLYKKTEIFYTKKNLGKVTFKEGIKALAKFNRGEVI